MPPPGRPPDHGAQNAVRGGDPERAHQERVDEHRKYHHEAELVEQRERGGEEAAERDSHDAARPRNDGPAALHAAHDGGLVVPARRPLLLDAAQQKDCARAGG